MINRIFSKTLPLIHTPRQNIHGYHGIVSQYMYPMHAESLIKEAKRPLKRTKLVCTIGPQCQTPQAIARLIDEGMNVARINFSHGTHAEHLAQKNVIVEGMKRRNTYIPIMLDTKGPEIRTGLNEDGKNIFLQRGQLLEIVTDPNHLGNNKRISCSYYNLPNATAVGRRILIADGTVQGTVKSIEKGVVTIQVHSDGKIGERKNMCLPGSKITLHTITEADEIDILEFGMKQKVDSIAVSFTRRGKDLIDLRQMMVSADPIHGRTCHLIAKIQNHEGLNNIDDIVANADGIMVARGDLGMEIPLEKVVMAQKYITDKAIRAGKYVINATQLMDSMENRPRPTRAQVADVTNMTLDLTDAGMLSAESAVGSFPFEAAGYIRKIVQETEYVTDYRSMFEERKKESKDYYATGAVGLSFSTRVSLIIMEIKNNYQIAQRLSALRPRAHIIVLTDNPSVRAGLAASFGVYCYPPLKSTNRKRMLEEFLVENGQDFAEDMRTPEAALFLSIDESRGYINNQEVIHV